jgi:hypothetical protein
MTPEGLLQKIASAAADALAVVAHWQNELKVMMTPGKKRSRTKREVLQVQPSPASPGLRTHALTPWQPKGSFATEAEDVSAT